jgi:hypothetical protein
MYQSVITDLSKKNAKKMKINLASRKKAGIMTSPHGKPTNN